MPHGAEHEGLFAGHCSQNLVMPSAAGLQEAPGLQSAQFPLLWGGSYDFFSPALFADLAHSLWSCSGDFSNFIAT